MIPLTVLAALIQAWVPRDPACSANSTLDTFTDTIQCHQCLIHLSIYLFIYYKIVHTVQDRQKGQSNIKRSGIKAK